MVRHERGFHLVPRFFENFVDRHRPGAAHKGRSNDSNGYSPVLRDELLLQEKALLRPAHRARMNLVALKGLEPPSKANRLGDDHRTPLVPEQLSHDPVADDQIKAPEVHESEIAP